MLQSQESCSAVIQRNVCISLACFSLHAGSAHERLISCLARAALQIYALPIVSVMNVFPNNALIYFMG